MQLYIFNPENDLALADGGAAYCPPPAASRIAYDLATLPLWFAGKDSFVVLPDALHFQYASEISKVFDVAKVYDNSMAGDVDNCTPWGWSPQIRRRLKAIGIQDDVMPSNETIAKIRELSNRRTAIKILESLKECGVDTPEVPLYLTEPDDVARFVNSMPRSVIKAPWSGSGKGIAWGIGHVELPVEHFYRGVIKRQGGVVCEHFLESVQEFAMEFHVGNSGVDFAGYSLFEAAKGSYSGNILAADEKIEKILSRHIPLHEIIKVKEKLMTVLSGLLLESGYVGYLGVDMMIYRDGELLRLNPCMELNLRMNMGVVSRLFHDSYVASGSEGRYAVTYYKNEGEALAEYEKFKAEYPLVVNDGKIVSGYMNLSPVTAESRYVAYVIINDKLFSANCL